MREAPKAVMFILITIFFCSCAQGTVTNAETRNNPALVIGQITYSPSGQLLPDIEINRKAIVEAAGGVIITEHADFSAEGLLTATKNMIANGCDGIILTPMFESALPQIANICEEEKVYWVISMRPINDPEIKQRVESSPYFVGMVMEDDESAGYTIIKSLAQIGKKEVALISGSILDSAIEARERGINMAAEEYGVDIVAQVRNCSSAEDMSRSINSFISAYPDLDAVVRVASFAQDSLAAMEAISDSDKWNNIKYASIDFERNMEEYFDKDMIAIVLGGHIPLDSSIATAMLVNAVMGKPINEDGSLTYKINYISLRSGNEMREFYDLLGNESAFFSMEKARNMLLKEYNPNLTVNDYQKIIDNYTIERLNRVFE